MKRAVILTLILLPPAIVSAADALDPRQAVERTPGDTEAAVRHLGEMLQKDYPANLFTEFDAGRVARPSDSAHYAASNILSLQRMGTVSVHF